MMSDLVEPKRQDTVYETDEPVLYEVADGVAWACKDATCVANKTSARPLRVCRALNRKFGEVAPDAEGRSKQMRFLMRIHDPLKQWKLSPMDLESRRRWEDYTRAKEVMLERTHIPEAPWWLVQAVDKKKARLNCISHLLTQLPYEEIEHPSIVLPERTRNPEYTRNPVPASMYVPDHY